MASVTAAAAPTVGRDGRHPSSVLSDAATRLPIAGVAVVIALGLVAPGLLERSGVALLALAIVVGLPHGAADHLMPAWAGLVMRPRRWALLLVAYVGASVVALAGLLVEPRVALALLALAAVHFGCGEVAVSALRSGSGPSVARAGAAVAGVGATIVAGPLALHPEATDPLLAGIHPDLPAAAPVEARLAVLALGLAAGMIAALLAVRAGDPTAAAELGLLLVLPLAVPPLAAFAVFFGVWHAPRHTLRLLAEDPRNHDDLVAGRVWPPLRRFLRAAAPTTAIAGFGVIALAIVAARGAPSLAIAALLALTVPHAVAVGWLDLRVARALR